MALYRGGSEPSAIYRGTVPVQKIMRGTVEVWSASIYPLTGTYIGGLAPVGLTVASHTMTEGGSFTLSLAGVTDNPRFGVSTAITGPWGTTSGSWGQYNSSVTTTRTLTAGDAVTFVVSGTATSPGSATWSIVKN